MTFGNRTIFTACLLFSTACGSAALAQVIQQDPVSRAATEVQQEAAAGQISQKEAGKREGQLWQLKSQEQQDMARHGGILTPQDKHELWSQIHSQQGNNDFDGNRWNSGQRHGGIMQGFNGNQNGYNGNQGGPNGYGQYPNAYNGNYQGNDYNNGYNGNGYEGGYNGNGNGYNNNNNSSGGSKFSQAASVLQGLLHH